MEYTEATKGLGNFSLKELLNYAIMWCHERVSELKPLGRKGLLKSFQVGHVMWYGKNTKLREGHVGVVKLEEGQNGCGHM